MLEWNTLVPTQEFLFHFINHQLKIHRTQIKPKRNWFLDVQIFLMKESNSSIMGSSFSYSTDPLPFKMLPYVTKHLCRHYYFIHYHISSVWFTQFVHEDEISQVRLAPSDFIPEKVTLPITFLINHRFGSGRATYLVLIVTSPIRNNDDHLFSRGRDVRKDAFGPNQLLVCHGQFMVRMY